MGHDFIKIAPEIARVCLYGFFSFEKRLRVRWYVVWKRGMAAMLCLTSSGAFTNVDDVQMNLARCTVHPRVLTRTLRLRGGAAPEGVLQARPQPMEDGNPSEGPSEGPQGPDFTRGFLDNGVSYAEQFAEQLKERRRMGHTIPVLTPAMFQGDDEGVSFDANGNFQLGEPWRCVVRLCMLSHLCAFTVSYRECFLTLPPLPVTLMMTQNTHIHGNALPHPAAAPPGYTPEEAMEVIRKESQELADMGVEVTIRSDVQNNRNTIARACNTRQMHAHLCGFV
jgi:hypothetical protein